MKIPTSKLRCLFALAGTLAAILTLTGAPLFADDRDILRESTTKPYLFVILDTSGSMNWAPKCTAAQVTAGDCDYHCETGDCAAPRDGVMNITLELNGLGTALVDNLEVIVVDPTAAIGGAAISPTASQDNSDTRLRNWFGSPR